MELSNKFGSVFVQSVKDKLEETYGAVKEAVPFVGQVEEFYAGTEDRANTRLLERGFSQEQIDAANAEKQKYTQTGEATSQFLDTVSDVTNIDRDLVGGAAFAAEMVLDARMGARMTLDTATGVAKVMPAQPVQALTIKNPDNLARGAAKGWAEGPEFGESMTKWRNRRMELREQMRNPSGLTANRRQKNKNKSLITAYNDVSTGPTRLVDNPLAYDKDPFKKVSSLEKRNMEQHHLFPKQESYQFVERMLKLGDEDDVLNLMIFAEEVDASMGGRLINMLNMERQPHTILHNSRKAIEDGRQLKSLEMKNLVENAKSSDELMELFKTYLETNIKPSKDEAFALNNLYEIAKKQGKHEEMYKALKNKGR